MHSVAKMSDNSHRKEMLSNIRFENIDALLFCGDIHGEFETIVYKLNQYDNAVIIKRKDNGKIIACVENDVNRQLHDFIIQNEGKVHALYYIWKYGKNRIYGCAYIRNRDEHR